MFLEYILSIHRDDLVRIISDVSLYNSYSINVDFLNLFEADPNTGDGVLCNPKNTLAKCDQDLIKAQQRILEEESSTSQQRLSVKQNVSARFYGLPVCPELHRSTIPKNKDLGCFLKVAGTAIRVTQSKMLEYRKSYKCMKCQHIQVVEGKYEQRYVIKPPNKCKNSDIQCRSTTFSPVHTVTRENCKDYQELKIQEQVNKLSVGGIPGSIWVTLENDLVDCCKPGDDVSICGIIMRRWNPVSLNKRCDVELVFKANHVEVCNAQKAIAVSIAPDVIKDFDDFWEKHKTSPMKGRDVVLASVCPKVYGLYLVKLALTLTVITGSSHNLDRDNSSPQKTLSSKEDQDRSVRGQCHLLLVGDPGTGKSQLLKAGAMMTSRSVLTSGSGSTKAGLTCTALREDGEWQLEAGALVLADGGACCIDELAQMREHDRASIHEAMEQQTISVAKAGIICKLNTRCAVIAACNPKGNYDTEQALSVNVSLGTPLLSRFDLIFILLDTLNQKWDNLVADYVLFGKTTEAKQLPKSWSLEKLQLYISLIGPYEVSISQKANTILRAYYVRQRSAENRDPSRTTVRMLDSLVRLSQAHARLMFRHVVLPMDAITAVSLMDLSMQDCTLSDTSDALHSTFSEYPDFEYLKTAKDLLSSLNLYEIWQDELGFYSKLLNVNKRLLEKDLDKGETKYFPHNISIEESSHLENASEIVESSFFKQPSKTAVDDGEKASRSDNDKSSQSSSQNIICSINKLGKTFLDIEKDDELDSILDFDDSICLATKRPIKTKGKANESISIEALVGKAEGNSEVDNVNTKLSVDRLAQTLKKHSTMNKITNINREGIITGKRKRETNKKRVDLSKKDKKRKCRDVPLQNVLNEINQVCDKQNTKLNTVKKTLPKTKKKGVANKLVDILSSSDEEINETDMLKCLPSVNDVFNDISTNFDQIDCDSDASMFENSLPLEENDSNHKPKLNAQDTAINCNSKIVSDDCKKVLTASETVLDESLKYRDKKNIGQQISPVNLKTIEKLQQFCFSSSKKKDEKCTENSTSIATLKSLKRVIDFQSENASRLDDKPIKSNNSMKFNQLNAVKSGKPNHSQASSSSARSQISIFENDDDLDVLDI